jgi:putative two-component system response regulator
MKVLIADDNLFYRRALEVTLVEWGYEVVGVADGLAAWEVLQQDAAPKLAILDWQMPGLDGTEVCRRVRGLLKPEPTYIIMLTSMSGRKNIVTALASGADDYLTKPFDHEELRARLQVGRRIVGLQTSQTVVFALARAVEAKSAYTQGHSDRVTMYALALASHVGVPQPERDLLHRGGLLHDIGKISVPDGILNKPGALTREEYEVIKKHPLDGVRIIEPLESMRDIIPLVRWHHERLDGSGYPDGLKGEEISPLVRILSVADVYDALASARPYRPAMSHDECIRILRSDAARGGLDQHLVECFEKAVTAPIVLPGRSADLMSQPLAPAVAAVPPVLSAS